MLIFVNFIMMWNLWRKWEWYLMNRRVVKCNIFAALTFLWILQILLADEKFFHCTSFLVTQHIFQRFWTKGTLLINSLIVFVYFLGTLTSSCFNKSSRFFFTFKVNHNNCCLKIDDKMQERMQLCSPFSQLVNTTKFPIFFIFFLITSLLVIFFNFFSTYYIN